MNTVVIEHILDCMATAGAAPEIQRIQTAHRLKLAEFWGIKEGARVLEIGCGQGDTLAVLAYKVGKDGKAHGVDIAPRDYGSPVTIGASIDYLKQSPLGKQVTVDFEFDVLSDEVEFEDDAFDYVVLSHCSWYMSSAQQLQDILTKVRRWGKVLCMAEWDTRIQQLSQLPHLLAVLIQAQYECFKVDSTANIRTLMTVEMIRDVSQKAGWRIQEEGTVDSSELQDARWETDITLMDAEEELKKLSGFPDKGKDLIHSQLFLLSEARKQYGAASLPSYVLTAVRDQR